MSKIVILFLMFCVLLFSQVTDCVAETEELNEYNLKVELVSKFTKYLDIRDAIVPEAPVSFEAKAKVLKSLKPVYGYITENNDIIKKQSNLKEGEVVDLIVKIQWVGNPLRTSETGYISSLTEGTQLLINAVENMSKKQRKVHGFDPKYPNKSKYVKEQKRELMLNIKGADINNWLKIVK